MQQPGFCPDGDCGSLFCNERFKCQWRWKRFLKTLRLSFKKCHSLSDKLIFTVSRELSSCCVFKKYLPLSRKCSVERPCLCFFPLSIIHSPHFFIICYYLYICCNLFIISVVLQAMQQQLGESSWSEAFYRGQFLASQYCTCLGILQFHCYSEWTFPFCQNLVWLPIPWL